MSTGKLKMGTLCVVSGVYLWTQTSHGNIFPRLRSHLAAAASSVRRGSRMRSQGSVGLVWPSGWRESAHTTPCQKSRFFMGGGESALERIEQAGHGGFEGTEEFRSGGSGAEVEQWEQTGGSEGFAGGEELPIGGVEVVTAGTRPDGPGWYGDGPLARKMLPPQPSVLMPRSSEWRRKSSLSLPFQRPSPRPT